MLQEVAQHPGNGWLMNSLQLSLSGRSLFLHPIEARASCSLSFQAAGGGGVLWFPNGELVGDRITGCSAKNILLSIHCYQIVFARTYILCEDTPGRMSI